MTKQQPTSLRLTPRAKSLRDALAEKLGVSKAAVVEMGIRKLAEREALWREDLPVIDAELEAREGGAGK